MSVPEKYQKGAPLPESIGRCADLYAETREMRLAMQKVVDAVAKREAEIREHIIQHLEASDDTGAAGLKYRAQIKKDTKPKVEDWEKVYDFIVEADRFDLLQRRIADKAVKDMWEEGEEVPGVGRIHVPSVSITKIA